MDLFFSTLLKKIELHGNNQETNLPSPNFYNWWENVVRKDLIFIICAHRIFAALAVYTTLFFFYINWALFIFWIVEPQQTWNIAISVLFTFQIKSKLSLFLKIPSQFYGSWSTNCPTMWAAPSCTPDLPQFPGLSSQLKENYRR